jgi:hypothetical protein
MNVEVIRDNMEDDREYFTKEELEELWEKCQEDLTSFEKALSKETQRRKKKLYKPKKSMQYKKNKNGKCAIPNCPKNAKGKRGIFCDDHTKARGKDQKLKSKRKQIILGCKDKSTYHNDATQIVTRMIREGYYKTPHECQQAINRRNNELNRINEKIQNECNIKISKHKWKRKPNNLVNWDYVRELRDERESILTQQAIFKRYRDNLKEKQQGLYGGNDGSTDVPLKNGNPTD